MEYSPVRLPWPCDSSAQGPVALLGHDLPAAISDINGGLRLINPSERECDRRNPLERLRVANESIAPRIGRDWVTVPPDREFGLTGAGNLHLHQMPFALPMLAADRAEAIHPLSIRAVDRFSAQTCGAFPADRHEAEGFGHIKASFSVAMADKIGAAGVADGGTLFSDGLCEIHLALQTEQLRFQQTSTIIAVGATRTHKAEVWIRCAPKRDPLEAVRRGQFRDDLCYQLHVIPITMPLMRDPRANVVDMAEVNLRRLSTKEHRSFTGFDRAVAELFKGLRWLVNLRQLLNVLWNRVALNQGRSLRFLCFHLKYPTRKTT